MELTNVLGAYEIRMGSSAVFSYSLTTTKEPKLVTFHREITPKVGFLLLWDVKLALGFIAFLA